MLIMPSVTMSGLSRSRVVNSPLTTPISAARRPATRAASQMSRPAVQQQRDDDAGQAGDGRHRKVEPAGDDQRRAGRRHQADEGDVGADGQHVAEAEEERREDREHGDQDEIEDAAAWRRPTRTCRTATAGQAARRGRSDAVACAHGRLVLRPAAKAGSLPGRAPSASRRRHARRSNRADHAATVEHQRAVGEAGDLLDIGGQDQHREAARRPARAARRRSPGARRRRRRASAPPGSAA